jgi:uncharacterized protein YodC (DUF2158 family)
MSQTPSKVGDVVVHKSGDSKFVVCDVQSEDVTVRWFAANKFYEQHLKAAELTKEEEVTGLKIEFVKPIAIKAEA